MSGLGALWGFIKSKLGSAAFRDVGTSAGNVVVLNGSAQLPAVDGSLLTNISGGGSQPIAWTACATESAFRTAVAAGENALATANMTLSASAIPPASADIAIGIADGVTVTFGASAGAAATCISAANNPTRIKFVRGIGAKFAAQGVSGNAVLVSDSSGCVLAGDFTLDCAGLTGSADLRTWGSSGPAGHVLALGDVRLLVLPGVATNTFSLSSASYGISDVERLLLNGLNTSTAFDIGGAGAALLVKSLKMTGTWRSTSGASSPLYITGAKVLIGDLDPSLASTQNAYLEAGRVDRYLASSSGTIYLGAAASVGIAPNSGRMEFRTSSGEAGVVIGTQATTIGFESTSRGGVILAPNCSTAFNPTDHAHAVVVGGSPTLSVSAPTTGFKGPLFVGSRINAGGTAFAAGALDSQLVGCHIENAFTVPSGCSIDLVGCNIDAALVVASGGKLRMFGCRGVPSGSGAITFNSGSVIRAFGCDFTNVAITNNSSDVLIVGSDDVEDDTTPVTRRYGNATLDALLDNHVAYWSGKSSPCPNKAPLAACNAGGNMFSVVGNVLSVSDAFDLVDPTDQMMALLNGWTPGYGPFTMRIDIDLDVASGGEENIIGDGTGNFALNLLSGGALRIYLGGVAYYDTSSSAITTGAGNQRVTVERTSTTLKIYVNGVQVLTTTDMSLIAPINYFYLGGVGANAIDGKVKKITLMNTGIADATEQLWDTYSLAGAGA